MDSRFRETISRLTDALAAEANAVDRAGAWPAAAIEHLTAAGAWGWMIPAEFGGAPLSAADQTAAYEAVAAGCMTTALVLTQRDGAVDLIVQGDNAALKADLLPRLARNEVFATVGISQLTTSQQGGRPALVARTDGEDFRLDGFMPWVTGAEKCQYIVTGAVCVDGGPSGSARSSGGGRSGDESSGDEQIEGWQILAAVPTDAPRVTVEAPMELAALQGSLTTRVVCKDVPLARSLVLRGPTEKALASRSTVKPIVVSACGVGLARSMLNLIREKAATASAELQRQAGLLESLYTATKQRLDAAAMSLEDDDASFSKSELRIAVNDLVLRLAIGTLTFAKGTGFLRANDAQRFVREAMFFLVWSAPEDIRARTLAGFVE